jgi:hypothetical protein
MAPEWDRKEPAAIQVAGFQVISENDGANLPPRCLSHAHKAGERRPRTGGC